MHALQMIIGFAGSLALLASLAVSPFTVIVGAQVGSGKRLDRDDAWAHSVMFTAICLFTAEPWVFAEASVVSPGKPLPVTLFSLGVLLWAGCCFYYGYKIGSIPKDESAKHETQRGNCLGGDYPTQTTGTEAVAGFFV